MIDVDHKVINDDYKISSAMSDSQKGRIDAMYSELSICHGNFALKNSQKTRYGM